MTNDRAYEIGVWSGKGPAPIRHALGGKPCKKEFHVISNFERPLPFESRHTWTCIHIHHCVASLTVMGKYNFYVVSFGEPSLCSWWYFLIFHNCDWASCGLVDLLSLRSNLVPKLYFTTTHVCRHTLILISTRVWWGDEEPGYEVV